ncbi:hypothetical protein [Thermicanus aegyptius]|uniref:hypothetical protein n=1 Tax=Thermicanus aegyptius TaxID=94009 RepID=UPI0012EB42C2|nr:hypothetical protein [Thermicanus aegyptius]
MIFFFVAPRSSVNLSIVFTVLALILLAPTLYLSWVAKTFRYIVDNGRLSIRMPSSISLHLDWAGQPTRYGSSAELWIMYGIFALLTLLFMG